MPRLQQYHHPDHLRPASLRQEMFRDLSKALAHFRAHHPEKANTWAHKLKVALIRAKILRDTED